MTSVEQEGQQAPSTSASAEQESQRSGQVNSGGESGKGLIDSVVGEVERVGEGLVVGAGAYTDGVTAPNPYYQYGNLDTGGYGGPPNLGAVSHVFAKARHDALVFAGQVVDDTTGNASGIGKGVGEGLAPELVTMPPLDPVTARQQAKANVEAAAAYQTAHPVMLHGLDEGVLAAGLEADEFGNPVDEGEGGSARNQTDQADGAEDDYSDHSSRQAAREQSNTSDRVNREAEAEQRSRGHQTSQDVSQGSQADWSSPSTSETQSGSQGGTQASSKPGPSGPRQRVDPTRSSD